ncbi:MAG: protein translocase subunit SecD [Actinomycetia bacterium]|nr:protein translocase subunit SecD [Actinomycetes bacterium]
MAPPAAGTLRVGRYFLALLGLFAVLYAVVFWPGQRHVPKLGLDLEGGTQVIFKAQTEGGGNPSSSAMTEAKQIIENRVNGSGVANATVVVQGSNQIVVSMPGKTPNDIADLGQAAQLNFRPVVSPPQYSSTLLAQATPTATATTTPTATGNAEATTTPAGTGAPTASGTASAPATGTAPAATDTPAATTAPPSAGTTTHSANAAGARPLGAVPTSAPAATGTAPASLTPEPRTPPTDTTAPTDTTGATGSAPAASTDAATPTATATSTGSTTGNADPLKSLGFTAPTTDTAFEALTSDQQTALNQALMSFDCTSKTYTQASYADKAIIACDDSNQYAFLLGPVIVPGTQISSAQANPPNGSSNLTWSVSLTLKSSGQTAWAKYTSEHHSSSGGNVQPVQQCSTSAVPCAEYVAFTLDGQIISYPHNEAVINGEATQITGSFTQSSATTLARQLKYGALPLNFTTDSVQEVSATLGTAQLKAGLLAGAIGLGLVVIYSLVYYRALGLITIASLLVSGGLVWAMLVVLGREMGFTLTLAGIAGFIVAVGITADSFVVYFERIKDEVHTGRTIRTAVPRAWVRAKRTILSADAVSFLAAAVLYYFAAGDVKGFAFTLGLSTILDLVVVFLFTHPIVSLLSRSAAFGSPRFTGLNAVRVGGIALTDPVEAIESAPGARRRSAGRAAPAQSAVAVLERDGEAEPDDEWDSVEQPEPSPARAASDGADDAPDAGDGEPGAPEDVDAEWRAKLGGSPGGDPPGGEPAPGRAKPAPGSAAERAAARRARMRAEQERKKGQR